MADIISWPFPYHTLPQAGGDGRQSPSLCFLFEMNYELLLNLTKQILVLRGGPGSGNWGHSGRPGKLGGSGKGGGLSLIGSNREASHKERKQAAAKFKQAAGGGDIDRYLAERRTQLSKISPLKKALKAQGLSESDSFAYMDVMTLSEDHFDRYGQKLGLKNLSELKEATFDQQAFLDRDIAATRWELQKRNTVKFGESRSVFGDIDDLPSVGKSADEATSILRDKYGVRVLIDEGVSPDRVHRDISRLIRSGDKYSPVAETLNQKVKAVHFRKESRYPGHTAVADFEIDKINVWTSNHGEMNAYTWVHEVGHGAEGFIRIGQIGKVFDRGKRPTMYAWGNPSENFAETFTMMVSGTGNRNTIKREMAEQYNLITEGVNGF